MLPSLPSFTGRPELPAPDLSQNTAAVSSARCPLRGAPALSPGLAARSATPALARGASVLTPAATLAWQDCTPVQVFDDRLVRVYAKKFGPFGAPPPRQSQLASYDAHAQVWRGTAAGQAPTVLDGEYIFVTMQDGSIRLSGQLRDGVNAHGQLSGGALLVRYAGRVKFAAGLLRQFNNDSGTFRPSAHLHHQAGWGHGPFIDQTPAAQRSAAHTASLPAM